MRDLPVRRDGAGVLGLRVQPAPPPKRLGGIILWLHKQNRNLASSEVKPHQVCWIEDKAYFTSKYVFKIKELNATKRYLCSVGTKTESLNALICKHTQFYEVFLNLS